MKQVILSAALVLSGCSTGQSFGPNDVTVRLETTAGNIDILVTPDKAPISSGDFLRYVDEGLYDNQGFYRVVNAENDPKEMGMSLIQGGRLDRKIMGAPIAHELTTQTGISNADGAVAIARLEPGTGSATYFFINIGNNDFLDTGGSRNPDGQGYATFGRVIKGLDVAKRIQAMETETAADDGVTAGQILTSPVIIMRAYRND